MKAYPVITKGKDIDPSGEYHCPLCKVQSTGDENDTGWVVCPIAKGKAICLGCCIDYQSVAVSEKFEEHPYYDLFVENSGLLKNLSPGELRKICLKHQEDIYKNDLVSVTDDDQRKKLKLRWTELICYWRKCKMGVCV